MSEKISITREVVHTDDRKMIMFILRSSEPLDIVPACGIAAEYATQLKDAVMEKRKSDLERQSALSVVKPKLIIP